VGALAASRGSCKERNVYTCPAGKLLNTSGTAHDGRTLLYRALKRDCDACPLKMRCCPKEPSRKVPSDDQIGLGAHTPPAIVVRTGVGTNHGAFVR
jgi:hypothetical protein